MAKRALIIVLGVAFLLAGLSWAGISGTDLWEPSLARTAGQNGSQWYATVWIHNPATQTAHVTVSFLVRDQSNLSPVQQTVTVDPGETLKLGDVYEDLFGLSSAIGALRFQSDRKIVVSARSYNLTAAGLADSQGQFIAGMPSELAIGTGKKTSIPGITNPANGSFRSNFALVETAGGTATVEVTLYNRDGTEVVSKTYRLAPYEPVQVSMHAFHSGAAVDGGRWDVKVLSGSGKVLTFASMVGNGTVSQDPSTLEMEYELTTQGSGSGLTQVAHDATLAGDGTSSSPLGIADNGVTTAKIANSAVTSSKIADGGVSSAKIANGAVAKSKLAASGGSNGQVLGTDGANLLWKNVSAGGLQLPYAGTANSSSQPAFRVINSGTALVGESQTGNGVSGSSHNPYAAGVGGTNTVGGGWGVVGSGPSGEGVHGQSTTGFGVVGVTTSGSGMLGKSGSGIGVRGESTSSIGVKGSSDTNTGVFGTSTSNIGVKGSSNTSIGVEGVSNTNTGVFGTSTSGRGVHGMSTSGDGVKGESQGASYSGVYGVNSSSSGYGVFGRNTGNGASGFLGGSYNYGSAGVVGKATSSSGAGVIAVSGPGSDAYGIYAESSNGYAGSFNGKVSVNGDLSVFGNVSKYGGSFKIDHPLDPEHKYLSHSFVESPDMMDIYNGNVRTDANGYAVVHLPQYFEALNRDFRYQLTVIGEFAQAIVAEEIHDGYFVVRTNLAEVKVSWQVTGIRHDPWANAHRIPVEEVKPEEEQGTYLVPKVYGQPEGRGLEARIEKLRRQGAEKAGTGR